MKRLTRTRWVSRMPRWNAAQAAMTLVALTLATAGAFAQTVEEMRLTVGKSIVLDYPADIRQISTSDPAIVDAVAVSTREVLLNAKAAGGATVIVWSREGQRTIYSITIEQNLESLRRLLKETFPNESIVIQSTRDSLALTGSVSTREIADRAVAMVTPFARSIVNNLQVAAAPVEDQILLKVRFAEVNRNKSSAFGVNPFSLGASNTIGRITTGQFPAPAPGNVGEGNNAFSIGDALNIFAFRPDLNLGATIRALQSEGVLQILAEPNLVTTTGKEASFLVGGEFPVPILQGGGNAGAVTVQFREFGIRLTFNPVVTPNGTIRMYVKPEVSTIDLANAVTVSGFLIPALATRRMETNVELGPGQSFVIGGLIDERTQESLNKVPGLSSIPLLGAIFKSREERKNRTELIVLVTPEVTKPIQAGEPTPMPVMPREFMGPSVPAEKKSSVDQPAADKQEKRADAPKPAKKAAAKGFFARKN